MRLPFLVYSIPQNDYMTTPKIMRSRWHGFCVLRSQRRRSHKNTCASGFYERNYGQCLITRFSVALSGKHPFHCTSNAPKIQRISINPNKYPPSGVEWGDLLHFAAISGQCSLWPNSTRTHTSMRLVAQCCIAGAISEFSQSKSKHRWPPHDRCLLFIRYAPFIQISILNHSPPQKPRLRVFFNMTRRRRRRDDGVHIK